MGWDGLLYNLGHGYIWLGVCLAVYVSLYVYVYGWLAGSKGHPKFLIFDGS